MTGANLLSWFSLGILAAAPVAVLVPTVGLALGFLITLCGLLGALLAHAVAEDRRDRAAVIRVAAAYMLAGAGAAAAGMWWMMAILTAGSIATALQAQRWAQSHPMDTTPAFA